MASTSITRHVYGHSLEEQPEAEDFTIKLETSIRLNQVSIQRSFPFSLDDFIDEDESPNKQELYYFLTESGIEDDEAQDMILFLVVEADDARASVSRSFKGVMTLFLHVWDEPDRQIQQAIRESLSETKIRFRPASKLVIKSLSRTRFKKLGVETKKCTICLETFVARAKVASLQCGHEFHNRCIVEWLGRSHLCPLCRFELPCEPESGQNHT